MKTIRHNTYETNSSSTHSITVINKKHDRVTKARTAPILTDNVLLPANLGQSEAYTTIETGEGGYVLKCRNSYQKAALTVHYLNDIEEYVKYDSGSMTSEQYESFKTTALNFLKESLGLDGIQSPEDCKDYYNYSEDGTSPIIGVADADDPIEAFKKYVADIVLNDDIIIIDEDIPY
jgi:hypothetical protein